MRRLVTLMGPLVVAVAVLAGCGGSGLTSGAPIPTQSTRASASPGGSATPTPVPTSTASTSANATPTASVTATPTVSITATPSAATAHYPVILIPGMTSVAATMEPMLLEFENAGWSSSTVSFWTDSSDMEGELSAAASELQTEVDAVLAQTGAQKVVLVTWSASTLAGRYYLRNIDSSKVLAYIAMAGPQHGTSDNMCQLYYSCQEFAAPTTPFLTALNTGTEVPGSPSVAYMTIRSDNDTNVVPESSAELAGANLNFELTGATAPTHFNYPSDAGTFSAIESFILSVEKSAPPVNTTKTPASPPPTPLTTPYPGTTYSTTCQTNSQFSDVTPFTFSATTGVTAPALDLCDGSIAFSSPDVPSGSGTIVSWLYAPLGAPAPMPTNPMSGFSNAPTVLYFTSLQLASGSSVVANGGAVSSPAITFDLGVAPVGTCTTYYELFGGSTIGWRPYGSGVAVAGSTTSVTFPAGSIASFPALDSTQTYYFGLVCF